MLGTARQARQGGEGRWKCSEIRGGGTKLSFPGLWLHNADVTIAALHFRLRCRTFSLSDAPHVADSDETSSQPTMSRKHYLSRTLCLLLVDAHPKTWKIFGFSHTLKIIARLNVPPTICAVKELWVTGTP